MTKGTCSREAKLPESCAGWQARRRARRQIGVYVGGLAIGRQRSVFARCGALWLTDLQAEEPIVPSLTGQELTVGAPFDDLAVMQHEDLVGVDDGAESMRNGDRGPTAHELGHGLLDLGLDLRVDRAGGFVED